MNKGEAQSLAAETFSNGSDKFMDSWYECSTAISSAETTVLGTRSAGALRAFLVRSMKTDGSAPFN